MLVNERAMNRTSGAHDFGHMKKKVKALLKESLSAKSLQRSKTVLTVSETSLTICDTVRLQSCIQNGEEGG